MDSAWDELARSERWRGVVSFIRQWVGPFDSNHGMPAGQLDEILQGKSLRLPTAVREWYLLAANWEQGGQNDWFPPSNLENSDGTVAILGDVHGVKCWGIRAEDFGNEDPPVFDQDYPAWFCPKFSHFVAAMVINDHIFNYELGEPCHVTSERARTVLQPLFPDTFEEFLADAPLESATVVAFDYSGKSGARAKARTDAGRALLQRLQET